MRVSNCCAAAARVGGPPGAQVSFRFFPLTGVPEGVTSCFSSSTTHRSAERSPDGSARSRSWPPGTISFCWTAVTGSPKGRCPGADAFDALLTFAAKQIGKVSATGGRDVVTQSSEMVVHAVDPVDVALRGRTRKHEPGGERDLVGQLRMNVTQPGVATGTMVSPTSGAPFSVAMCATAVPGNAARFDQGDPGQDPFGAVPFADHRVFSLHPLPVRGMHQHRGRSRDGGSGPPASPAGAGGWPRSPLLRRVRRSCRAAAGRERWADPAAGCPLRSGPGRSAGRCRTPVRDAGGGFPVPVLRGPVRAGGPPVRPSWSAPARRRGRIVVRPRGSGRSRRAAFRCPGVRPRTFGTAKRSCGHSGISPRLEVKG